MSLNERLRRARRDLNALAIGFCIILVPASAPAAKNRVAFRTVQAELIRVTDGDTLVVRDQNGKKQRIRLAGIDAPELHQPYGKQSKASLRKLLGEHVLQLRVTKTDRYGRLIATVKAGSTRVGLAQINSGSAWFYRRYRREQSKADQQKYGAAEARARRLGRGLWQQTDPIAPWVYRRKQRQRR